MVKSKIVCGPDLILINPIRIGLTSVSPYQSQSKQTTTPILSCRTSLQSTNVNILAQDNLLSEANQEKIGKFVLINLLDIFMSGIGYAITAMGCLGWGKNIFPKHEKLLEKHGSNISTALNTGISVGRVFLSPSVSPVSLTMAAISPTITNRLYRWADVNKAKRYETANNSVYTIGVLAKASKRFTSPEEAKSALLESIVSRLGRNVTKEQMFNMLGTSREPHSNAEQIKTIGSKLVSKYTWNFLCFGLLDWLLNDVLFKNKPD